MTRLFLSKKIKLLLVTLFQTQILPHLSLQILQLNDHWQYEPVTNLAACRDQSKYPSYYQDHDNEFLLYGVECEKA